MLPYPRDHWTNVLFFLVHIYTLPKSINLHLMNDTNIKEVLEMGNRRPTGYDPVQIFNSTSFNAFGKVEYASIFCSDDNYAVQRDETWTASSRGVCLVTRITATVRTPSGNIEAEPYTSSGTSFSKFAIIQVGVNKFQVTRVVSTSRRK